MLSNSTDEDHTCYLAGRDVSGEVAHEKRHINIRCSLRCEVPESQAAASLGRAGGARLLEA